MRFTMQVSKTVPMSHWLGTTCGVGMLGLTALPLGCAAGPSPSAAPVARPDAASPPAAPAAERTPPAPRGLDPVERAESRAQDDEFTSLESAERALNQAKADLDRLALAEPPVTVGRGAPADGASKAEKKDAQREQSPSATGAASAAPSARCENTCRAFASLSRAAHAVCRLDGETGAHCSQAKQIVQSAQPHIASCACPAGG